MNTNAKFNYGEYYHVYARTNNKERLFRSQENRNYFLRRLNHYLGGYVSFHSYALMSNHYHLSIKVKNEDEICEEIESKPVSEYSIVQSRYLASVERGEMVSELIVSQFRRFHISYSQSFNKMYGRQGNLINRPFKRSLYDPDVKFYYLQYYIHHNGRKHKVVKNFQDYVHHSYFEISESDSEIIDMSEIIQRYGSINKFVDFHNAVHYEDKFEDLIIED